VNAVSIEVRDVARPVWADRAAAYAGRVLDELGAEDWDLSVLLCGDAFIEDLNAGYRHMDGPTDVLSFPQGQWYGEGIARRYLAGDVVVSLETLERNAVEFSVPLDEELRRLLVHGILHLSGMDHETNDPAEPMLARQESLLAKLSEAVVP